MSLLDRILRRPRGSDIRQLTISLPGDTLEVLRRTAAREGLPLEAWAAQLLSAQATKERRERATLEASAERVREAALQEMDRQDEMEELVARAERGEFTTEQWNEICRRASSVPVGEPLLPENW